MANRADRLAKLESTQRQRGWEPFHVSIRHLIVDAGLPVPSWPATAEEQAAWEAVAVRHESYLLAHPPRLEDVVIERQTVDARDLAAAEALHG
jgi:hypothetical protein